MSTPKISVIVPVYNIGTYLTKCLDSCFNQSYPNIEVIAINDGSKDSSGSILEDYAKNEPRLKVIHQENRGVVVAREEGLKVSNGEYICFVDGDDYIDVRMIEELLHSIEKERSDVSICSFELVDEQDNLIKVNKDFLIGDDREQVLSSMFLRKCGWTLCGKLFKKELFAEILMPYGVKMGEDGLVCFQAVSRAKKVSLVDKAYYKYVQRMTSAVHTFDKSTCDSVLKFMQMTLNYKEIYKWSQYIEHSLKEFLISQLFVYYVYGGLAKYINRDIISVISFKDICFSKLNVKEKMVLIIFLKFTFLSDLLRPTIQKRCLSI